MGRRITLYEPDPVIAQDIAETVAATLGGAALAAVGSLADLASGSARNGDIAILHASEAELLEPELTAALEAAGTRVIAIHRPLSSPSASRWIFVPPPFTDETLRGALLVATASAD